MSLFLLWSEEHSTVGLIVRASSQLGMGDYEGPSLGPGSLKKLGWAKLSWAIYPHMPVKENKPSWESEKGDLFIVATSRRRRNKWVQGPQNLFLEV